MKNNRRNFLASIGAIGLAGASPEFLQETKQEKESKAPTTKAEDKPDAKQKEKPKKLDSKMVNQFVGFSHGNLKGVKELLEKEPALINAAWDWANGDFETGLNAASHVGNRPIAEFLLEKGARLDVCAAVMLGMKGIVSEMLKVNPKLHLVNGAHSIPLIHHAIFGRQEAHEVLELLIEKDTDVNRSSKSGMTPLMAAVTTGRVETVEFLITKGADVDAKNSKDQTALDIAKKRKKDEVVKFLESRSQ